MTDRDDDPQGKRRARGESRSRVLGSLLLGFVMLCGVVWVNTSTATLQKNLEAKLEKHSQTLQHTHSDYHTHGNNRKLRVMDDTKLNSPNVHERIGHFKDIALQLDPVSDKIGMTNRHRFHNMYGMFLLPLVQYKPTLKVLDIGLACNNNRPGTSVALWKTLMPQADLWEADPDAKCVEKAQKKGQLEGINVLVGDQANAKVLDGWIEKSKGRFDVIIDDGGHHNCQISNSFDKLWPQLNPGGFYFIEDLHVGRAHQKISDDCGKLIMSEKLEEWMHHLIYLTNPLGSKYQYGDLPKDLLFVHCQAEACVLGKRQGEVNDPVSLHPNQNHKKGTKK